MSDRSSDYLWGAFAFVAAVFVAFISFDGVGRLVVFLHGEQQYLAIGFVVFLYVIAIAIGRWSLDGDLKYINGELDKRMIALEKSHETLKFQGGNRKTDYEQVRKELAFLRKLIEQQWKQNEKAIKKVDELMAQKTPVLIQSPSPDTLQAAVVDVVGGGA
jgi:hypothetical protein